MATTVPLRVLFDENMSSRVANALELLEKDVSWVGKKRHIKKGTEDPDVARIARNQGR